MRYTQDGPVIKGPGLPEQGVCAVGPAELEAAHRHGYLDGWDQSLSDIWGMFHTKYPVFGPSGISKYKQLRMIADIFLLERKA